jgi:thioredoxin 1
MVTDLDLINFHDSIEEEKIALVKFWAPWCGPCKTYAPVYEKFAEDNTNVACFSVDCEEFPDLASEFDIMSIPATLVFKDGKLADTKQGKLTVEQLQNLVK